MGPRRAASGIVALSLVLVIVLADSSSTSAHTGFESSSPAEGEVVDAPLDTVTLSFTGAATPAGEGFLALDTSGIARAPQTVTTNDGRDFVLSFDPPLATGVVGIRWEVQAGDAHPVRGSFSFTVNPPPPSPTTTVAGLPSNDTPVPAEPVSGADAPRPTRDAAAPAATSVEAAEAPEFVSGDAPPATSPTSMESFLAGGEQESTDLLALAGRVLGFIGVVLALGGLAFLTWTFRGSCTEISFLVSAVRVLGLVAAVGAALELAGRAAAGDEMISAPWTSSPAIAAGLRLVGGLTIAAGDRFAVVPDPVGTTPRALSAAVVEVPARATRRGHERFRWSWRAGRFAAAGAALTVASFWFDGHTVSEGIRPVHAAVNALHVIAGSVWVGGAAAMAAVVWHRRRQQRPSGGAELAIRFSSAASVALVAVAAAGMAMGALILDSVTEVVMTEWGRMLTIKTAAVSVAASLGAYNHFRLIPKLKARPEDGALGKELRTTVTAETFVLVLVVILTASLVAAAT